MPNILVNNIKISNIQIVENALNTIVCKDIKEEFFGVSTIDIGNDKILCEYSQNNIVKLNLKIDGKEYKNIPFKLILDSSSKCGLFLNKSSLDQPSLFEKKLLEENVDFSPNFIPETNNNPSNDKAKREKIAIKKKHIENTIRKTIEEGVEEYRQKLFEDFVELNNKQSQFKNKLINDPVESLKESFNENYIKSVTDQFIEGYIKEIDHKNENLQKNLGEQILFIERKLEKFIPENKEIAIKAAERIVEEDLRNDGNIKKFKDQLLKDIQKTAEGYATDANKRMMRYAEMMSGGGSNAVQFANGGTMHGDLDVRGRYLSGGIDISTFFTKNSGGGGSGRDDVNTLVVSSSSNWNEAYEISTYFRDTSGSFITGTYLDSVSSLLTPLVLTNTLTGQLLPISVYQSTSSDYDSTFTTVRSNSANWVGGSGRDDVNTLVVSSSASWNNTETTVRSGSASWGSGGIGSTPLSANDNGTTISVATNQSKNYYFTLYGNRVLVFTGLVAGYSGSMMVTQDGSGNRTLSLSSNPPSKTPSGAGIILSTSPNATDTVSYYYDGNTLYVTSGPKGWA